MRRVRRPGLHARQRACRWPLAFVMLAGLLLGGCGLPHTLTPSLPDAERTVGIADVLTQPFLSSSDGLSGLRIGVAPRTDLEGATLPRPAGGATVAVRYAPEVDPRFPEGAFHDWPVHQQWLGELAGERTIGQTFMSPYPGLSGITLRVATFGSDLSPGTARVRDDEPVVVAALPETDQQVAVLAPGSRVEVTGSAEGWAAVRLPDGTMGYAPLDAFAELPPPQRVNDHDVVFSLYDNTGTTVRQVTVNARDLHDNSHVTFTFDPLPDSSGAHYRFEVVAPDATANSAVTFRFDPSDVYPEGTRLENGEPAGGDLIFRPTYTQSDPLVSASLDSFSWSGLDQTLSGSFTPLAGTADRYLTLEIHRGDAPIDVSWSLLRPPGGLPMTVDGDSSDPGGGLVFNVTYRQPVALADIIGQTVDSLGDAAAHDPLFFGAYGLAIVLVASAGIRLSRRRPDRGD